MSENELKECQFCKTEIKKGATICPNCKKDLRNWLSKHPILTIIVILFTISMIWNNYGNSINKSINSWNNYGNSVNKPINSWSCSSEMKTEVANEYKSPSTVKFISCNWDKSKWIFWEADAENGFWWTIRSSFLCNWNSCIITQK